MRKHLLLPSALALAVCLTGAGFAAAQDAPPPPPPPPHHGWGPGGEGPGGMRGMPMHGMHGMHGHGMRGADRAMRLAKHLSTMETLLGIRSDQLDAWRAFTAAAIDFASPSRPKPMDDADKPDRGEAFAMADRMADRAIARAEKAKALKDAVAALRQKLTPEQLDRVKAVEGEMRERFRGRHGGPGGPGRAGPMRGPGGPGPDAPPAPDQQPN